MNWIYSSAYKLLLKRTKITNDANKQTNYHCTNYGNYTTPPPTNVHSQKVSTTIQTLSRTTTCQIRLPFHPKDTTIQCTQTKLLFLSYLQKKKKEKNISSINCKATHGRHTNRKYILQCFFFSWSASYRVLAPGKNP